MKPAEQLASSWMVASAGLRCFKPEPAWGRMLGDSASNLRVGDTTVVPKEVNEICLKSKQTGSQ